jgi:hypothetical protein
MVLVWLVKVLEKERKKERKKIVSFFNIFRLYNNSNIKTISI